MILTRVIGTIRESGITFELVEREAKETASSYVIEKTETRNGRRIAKANYKWLDNFEAMFGSDWRMAYASWALPHEIEEQKATILKALLGYVEHQNKIANLLNSGVNKYFTKDETLPQ